MSRREAALAGVAALTVAVLPVPEVRPRPAPLHQLKQRLRIAKTAMRIVL